MAKIKHRPFNADRFLDKFKAHRDSLVAYLNRWDGQIPGLPEPLEVDAFKEFLKTPPVDCRPFEEMVEGIYRAWDLCTKQGEEHMHDAAERNQSSLNDVHDIPREVFALRLYVEDLSSFQLAENLNHAQHVDKFVTFKGKGPASVENVEGAVALFKAELQGFFTERKGSEKVLVKHFLDGDVLNFIIYHEERVKAEIQLQEDGTTLTIQPLIFRPARQDFLSYFPAVGKIQIDNPSPKERAAMRRAFGLVCLDDESFFEEQGAEAVVDLSGLAASDFELQTDHGDSAKLTEIVFRLHQAHKPCLTVRSGDVYATLEANGLRELLAHSQILSAKIKLFMAGAKRGKSIELKHPNSLSFNRSTHAQQVMDYLARWNLHLG